MTPTAALVARLDALVWRLDRFEYPHPDEMGALADAAVQLAPEVTEDERRQLRDAVDRVADALERGRAGILGKVQTLAVGRRAAKAYAGGRGPRP